MYVCIYIYIYIYKCSSRYWIANDIALRREYLSTAYRLRFSSGINWIKRFSTNTYRDIVLLLQTSPNITDLREFTG